MSTRAYGDEDRKAWLHSLPCVAAGTPGHVCDPWDMDTGRAVIQAMHVRARGMGSAKGEAVDQVPACPSAHREAGEYGTEARLRFEAKTGLDLVECAARYDQAWREISTGEPSTRPTSGSPRR